MFPPAPLLAVHIADGILAAPWWVGGFVAAAALAGLGAFRIRDEEIPRLALLTAAFFVASLVHVRLGPTSVHLILNGLVGIILGRRAGLAVLVGLALQTYLIEHGGKTTIGINACIITLPALLARPLFRAVAGGPASGQRPRAFLGGFIAGAGAVVLTAGLNSLVLVLAGEDDWRTVAALVFAAHLPLAAVEGVVTGFAAEFLSRVKPELLGDAHTSDQGKTSSSDTSH